MTKLKSKSGDQLKELNRLELTSTCDAIEVVAIPAKHYVVV